jgi:hypothetical protein
MGAVGALQPAGFTPDPTTLYLENLKNPVDCD